MNKKNQSARVAAMEELCLVLGATLALSILGPALPAVAQEWIDPGEDSWFEPSNWNPATVPGNGATAMINNGGTAVLDAGLDGVTETSQLGTLNLGRAFAPTGTFSGSVSSTGVAIRSHSAYLGVSLNQTGPITAWGSLTSDSEVEIGGGALRSARSSTRAPARRPRASCTRKR